LILQIESMTTPPTLNCLPMPTPPRGAFLAWTCEDAQLDSDLVATLQLDLETFSLPPGTAPETLFLASYRGGRWHALPEAQKDGLVLQAAFEAHSIYGLVAPPAEVSARGSQWHANGVTLTASAPVYSRLYVSPQAIFLYVNNATPNTVDLNLSGLPTDDTYQLYSDRQGPLHTLAASDTQLATHVAGESELFMWLQRSVTTYTLGGQNDECHLIGVREGEICTLTGNVSGRIQIVESNQILDCDGHAITQEAQSHGEGIAILVPGPAQSSPTIKNISIERCTIGAPGNAYATGILLSSTRFANIHHNTFADNAIAVSALNTEEAFIGTNSIISPDYGTGIEIWGPNTIGTANVLGNTLTLGADSVGIELRGLSSGEVIPIEDVSIAENQLSGPNSATALRLRLAEGNHIVNNHFNGDGVQALGVAIDIREGGWPNTIWHNAIEAETGLLGDAVTAEVSHNQKGNWWGRQCPGPLFVAGVDTDPATLVDSYPYSGSDYWKHGIATGCNLSPPDPPTLLSPIAGSETLSLRPTFTGRAARHTVISFYDGQSLIGESQVDLAGYFDFVPDLDFAPGSHTLSVIATDFAGQSSTPLSHTFAVRTVDAANPLWGINKKAHIFALELGPIPFNPSQGEESVLAIGIDATSAVAGAPPSHVFFAVSRRTLRDNESLEELRTLYAAAEISHASPSQVSLSSAWDGTTDAGQWVLADRGYPADVEVIVGRVIPFAGWPPPSCPAGEVPLTLSPGMVTQLALVMPHIWWQDRLLKICKVAYFESLLANATTKPLAPIDLTRFFNPCIRKAANCDEAYTACMNSKVAGDAVNIVIDGKVYTERCAACQARCKDQDPDKWIGRAQGLDCNYWGNQFYKQCFFHDCSDPNAPDPCTDCPEGIAGGEGQCACPPSANPCHYCQDNGLTYGEGCPGNDFNSVSEPTFGD